MGKDQSTHHHRKQLAEATLFPEQGRSSICSVVAALILEIPGFANRNYDSAFSIIL